MTAATALEDFLTERNHYVRPDIYRAAAEAARMSQTSVLNLLMSKGMLTADQAYEAYAHERGWDLHRVPEDFKIPDDVVSLIPPSDARRLNVVPVGRRAGRSVIIAMENPDDQNMAKVLQGIIGEPVSAVYAPNADIASAVRRYYSTSLEATSIGQRAAEDLGQQAGISASMESRDSDSQIARVLKVIIDGALDAGASDIHLEPGLDFLNVRYSIDGKNHNEPPQSRELSAAIARVIKVRSKLHSSDLHPQSGSMEHKYNGRTVELRAAVLPTPFGESITLRPNGGEIRPLTSIGFTAAREKAWRRQLAQPSGLVLAVGPMGCGKTSLNYASLDVLMKENRKIVSLERPIETKFPSGITQTEINPDQGRDWDEALAVTLRKGASVLNIGEINEPRIAKIVVDAALSGHLVLSTLHTNDAAGTIVRLREMGIRPSVLADTLRAVCSQRLPRMLCSCKVRVNPTAEQIEDFQLTPEDVAGTEWYGPSEYGCPRCRHMGYKGRTPIHELMTIGQELHELILDDVPARQITAAARETGMKTLREDGLDKVRQGVTSLAEIRSHILVY